MKITKVETIRLMMRPNLLWVRIYTDEGLVGLGETWFGTLAVESDLHDRIAPMLVGEHAGKIELLNRKLRPYVGFLGTSTEIRACSAVDVALWDLAGKAANQPIYQLLGGATREKIRVYNTCAGADYVSKSSDVKPGNFGVSGKEQTGGLYEDLIGFMTRADEVASSLLEMGITAMKIWPFDFAEGAADGMDISVDDMKRALEPFEKIRNAHGDKMRLKAELHGIWSLSAAKKICAALEPLEMDWIEDPIWMDRISDLKALCGTVTAPIAGGETLGGLGQLREIMQLGAISTPIIDVTWGGGITFAKKVAGIAEAFALPVAFHDCSGPITLAASTHLAMVCPNVAEQEITRAFYYGWYQDLIDTPPPIEEGHIRAPDGPGLGVELLPDLTKRPDAVVRATTA